MFRFSSCFSSVRTLALAALLLTGALAAQAQPGNGGTTGGPPSPQAAPLGPTAVPLDGGASLLAASGVAYALKRLRKRRAH